ncbi:MAG: DUF4446 family protein [Armatimonadota bacterium]|jgi:hypothetical protein
MTELAITLSHYAGWLLLFLLVIIGVISIILVRFSILLNRTRSKFGQLLNENSSQNVEELLLEHMKERQELRNHIEQLDERVVSLERKLQRSKRHLGLVRYDAFSDIGGNQSFTLAVYDDNGDGAILSSIVGRADNKVYGKNLINGKSDHNLTDEDQQAILEAVKVVTKSTE